MNELWSKPPDFVDVGDARIAYRRVGHGPPLLLIHGWPLSSWSFRRVLPRLAERFTCFLPDTPGLGESEWLDPPPATSGASQLLSPSRRPAATPPASGGSLPLSQSRRPAPAPPASGRSLSPGQSRRPRTDFLFTAQAERLQRFADGVGTSDYSLFAFDTGATLARQLARIDAARVRRLVLLNTEIPGHRPPWIPLFQRTLGLPGSRFAMTLLLRSRALRRSSLGFGGCFCDPALLEGEFFAGSIAPLLADPRRLEGARRYLGGIDWALVDGFARRHREITAPVLFVWGADDPTFPIERARPMAGQLADCRGFVAVPRARLLVHEEQPGAVLDAALPFLCGE